MIPYSWTRVLEDRSGEAALEIKVEQLSTGGFLVLTRHSGGDGDLWLETEEEVLECLSDFYVLDGPARTRTV